MKKKKYGAIGVLASVGGVAVLEGRKALQEDLSSLKRWAEAEGQRFPRAWCRILRWGHRSPCTAWGTGAGKGPGVLGESS